MSHRAFKLNRPSIIIMDDINGEQRVPNIQLQQAAGTEVATIIPMAVGQKYLRRDGKVVMIVQEKPLGYFTCSDKWCYICKTIDPENGWNIYSFESNDEDLVSLLPIGAIAGNETKN